MRLLILTQKIDNNDDNLGFFHRWVEEFAKHCESIIVICLQKGEFHLPSNVRVISLGKENGRSRMKYLLLFYYFIIKERKNYEYVWTHMNPEYILLGGLFWKLWGKKITLWYAHGHINWILRTAEKIVDVIFTSTQNGCRLNSQKIKIVGQGIDINFFVPSKHIKLDYRVFKIISVGRFSPVKDYPALIKAVEMLNVEGIPLDVNIIGGPALAKDALLPFLLKKMVKDKKLDSVVHFLGSKPNKAILPYLQESDLFVNMSHTGSLDKAVLEAMAIGLPIFTCNEALEEVLGNYQEILMYPKGNYTVLAEKIKMIINLSPAKREEISDALREIVVKNHSLNNFVKKILEIIK